MSQWLGLWCLLTGSQFSGLPCLTLTVTLEAVVCLKDDVCCGKAFIKSGVPILSVLRIFLYRKRAIKLYELFFPHRDDPMCSSSFSLIVW